MFILKKPLVWLLLVAAVMLSQFPLYLPYVDHGDPVRFIAQAKSLCAGDGYIGKAIWSWIGSGTRPETALPPGYPIFLAGVMFSTSDTGQTFYFVVTLLQMLMALLSCCLVYAAIRPRSVPWAILGGAILATSLPFLSLSRLFLSETLAAFLCSLLIFQVSRMETSGATAWQSISIGLLCVAILLTAPALIILCFLVWCYCAWHNRRRPAELALLALGSLLLMIPWQVHCYWATGHIQPTVYAHMPTFSSGFTRWVRTWAERPAEESVFWRAENFMVVPETAFSSPAEQAELTALYQKAHDEMQIRWEQENDGQLFAPEVENAFSKAADKKIANSPWRFYFGLPLRRAAYLWFSGAPQGMSIMTVRGILMFLALNVTSIGLFLADAHRHYSLHQKQIPNAAAHCVLGCHLHFGERDSGPGRIPPEFSILSRDIVYSFLHFHLSAKERFFARCHEAKDIFFFPHRFGGRFNSTPFEHGRLERWAEDCIVEAAVIRCRTIPTDTLLRQ